MVPPEAIQQQRQTAHGESPRASRHSRARPGRAGPACWLWDYLRRSNQGGYFVALSARSSPRPPKAGGARLRRRSSHNPLARPPSQPCSPCLSHCSDILSPLPPCNPPRPLLSREGGTEAKSPPPVPLRTLLRGAPAVLDAPGVLRSVTFKTIVILPSGSESINKDLDVETASP